MRKLIALLLALNASSSLQIQVKVFFEQLCLGANALVNFFVLRRIWAVSDGFPTVPVRPNRNHQIFRQGKSFADGPLDHNFELKGRFLSLHGTASRDIGSAKVPRSEAFFFKTQNPRRAGQGSAGGWFEASSWTRCQPKDPRNSTVASRFLQARSLSNILALCTTSALVALTAIVFGVCSPAAAQGFNGGCFNCGLGPFAPPPSFSLTYESSATSTAGTTSINYGTMTWVNGQYIVMGLSFFDNFSPTTVSSITVGGVSLVQVSGAFQSRGAAGAQVDVWISPSPMASASGNVTVVYTQSPNLFGAPSSIAIYSLSTTTPAAASTSGNIYSSGTNPYVATPAVPTGGGALVVAYNENGSAISFWSAATGDVVLNGPSLRPCKFFWNECS
jgi:hypothetical protein